MNALRIVAGFVLALMLVACGKESGVQRPADLSIYFTIPPSVQGQSYDPDKVFTLPPPSSVTNTSFMDVEVFNQGESSMNLLNVYLAEGSNQYVTLEWAESDPSGAGRFSSGEAVSACSPATATVSDPSLLPTAKNVNPALCSFPMELDGQDPVTNLLESRKFRLKYSFDVATQAPDSSPVTLLVHIDWQEGALGTQGVVSIPIQVEGCIPLISFYPPSIQFSGTKSGSTDEVEVCLSNNGCEELTVIGVTLSEASVGEVFEIQDKRACSETQNPCFTDADCGLCENNQNYCGDDLHCPGSSCEQGAGGTCQLEYGQAIIGAVIEPIQENPEAQVCFKAIYSPFEGSAEVDDTNYVIITTNDPIQPTIQIPMSENKCEFEYQMTHTDEVASELPYMDFTGVVFPDTGMKTITVTNTAGAQGCPIKLNSLAFATGSDAQNGGGAFWAEIRKDGASQGFFGKTGQPAVGPVVITADGAFDVDVHFEPQDGVVVNPTEITLNMASGTDNFSRDVSIQAGDATSKLVLGPSAVAAGNQVLFWYSADSSEEESIKTLSLYNEGLAPVLLDSITLDTGNGQSPDDYFLYDDDECVVGGEFICTEIPPLGLITVWVTFSPVSGLFKSSAFLYVWTEADPFTGESGAVANYSVNLQGYAGLTKSEPYAEAFAVDGVVSEDEEGYIVYNGFSPGDSVVLDASLSEAYDGTTIVDQGYKWWLVYKPEASAAKLNEIGGSQATLVVDKPGYYTVNLVATAQDPQTSDFLLSEENWVDIYVE